MMFISWLSRIVTTCVGLALVITIKVNFNIINSCNIIIILKHNYTFILAQCDLENNRYLCVISRIRGHHAAKGCDVLRVGTYYYGILYAE